MLHLTTRHLLLRQYSTESLVWRTAAINTASTTLAQIDGAITARFVLQHLLELRIQLAGRSARQAFPT
jgi:hypothetical protein